jgi:hypothetical protein
LIVKNSHKIFKGKHNGKMVPSFYLENEKEEKD